MGKAGRKMKHEDKMKMRRAAKAAKRAKYQSLKGTSRKQKRQGLRRIGSSYKHAHLMACCGNIGCLRCFPRKVSA